MKLGYLHMIRKPSNNQCSGSQHHFQDQEKHGWVVRSSRPVCFLWYPGYCDGRVGTQRPDGKSAVLHWSLDEIAWTCEKETTELWRNGWILHQDNAPAHNASSVKQFLANKNITVLEYPPYSPDLTPCDFCLFPKIKSVLKGTHFVSVEDVKAKTVETLTAIQNMTGGIALNTGSIVCSCVSTLKGTILRAIVVYFLNLLNRKSYRHSLVFFLSDHVFVRMLRFGPKWCSRLQYSTGLPSIPCLNQSTTQKLSKIQSIERLDNGDQCIVTACRFLPLRHLHRATEINHDRHQSGFLM